MQIITFQVAKLRKPDENSGLGIALEGTVEVEDGKEVRPHHYIRDIQTGGPVGLNGVLQRGDELLEVSSRSNTSKYQNMYISTNKRSLENKTSHSNQTGESIIEINCISDTLSRVIS